MSPSWAILSSTLLEDYSMELILLVVGVLLFVWLLLSLDIWIVQREPVAVALIAGLLTLLAFPLGVFLGVQISKK